MTGVEPHRLQPRLEVEVDPDRLAGGTLQQGPELLEPAIEVDRLGLHKLASGERQQLLGDIAAPPSGQCDLVGDAPHASRVFGASAQHLRAAEDDGQQIVEIVRDPARQLPHGFQALRSEQGLLGALPASDLGLRPGQCLLLPPGADQRRPGDRQERECRRYAEDEVAHHGGAPAGDDNLAAASGHHVHRVPGDLAIGKKAGRTVLVDDRAVLVDAFVRAGAGCGKKRAVAGRSRWRAGERRKTDQDLTIVSDQGDDVALARLAGVADQNFVEVEEEGGRHRDVDHPGNLVAGPDPWACQAEEQLPVHVADLQAADIGPGVSADDGLEVVAVPYRQTGRDRIGAGAHQRSPVPIREQDALDLRQPGNDPSKGLVQGGFRSLDGTRVHALDKVADPVGDLALAIEHFRGVLSGDLADAAQLQDGVRQGRVVVDPGGTGEQQRRDEHGGDQQHP